MFISEFSRNHVIQNNNTILNSNEVHVKQCADIYETVSAKCFKSESSTELLSLWLNQWLCP